MNNTLLEKEAHGIVSTNLSDIYGKDVILNPRASFSNFGFLPRNPLKFDFLTGRELLIAGDMPVLCSEAVQSNLIINSFKRMGFNISDNRIVYTNVNEYYNKLEFFQLKNKKVVFQHVHPDYELDCNNYWIEPKVLSFLNNKEHINNIVPKEYIPNRQKISTNYLKDYLLKSNLPIVVKSGMDTPTGGGYGVFICKVKEDIDKVIKMFKNATEVIIEEYISAKNNYCVQFAINKDNQIIYIGSSEQLVDSEGKHQGNWLHKNNIPQEVIKVGYLIMKKAKELGYVGIAGFDILVSDTNNYYVIDLNFRLNGSTSSLILFNKLKHTLTNEGVRLHTFKVEADINETLRVFEQLFERERAIPLSFYDPLKSPYRDAMPYVTCLIPGNRLEETFEFSQFVAEKFGLTLN